MSRMSLRLAETDGHIRDCTQHIELYRRRIAERAQNPALAEEAERLLPPVLLRLKELARLRRHLAVAVELEAAFARQDDIKRLRVPRRPCRATS